jgi:glutathionylspermidine synthase
MIPSIRKSFNENFTTACYQDFIKSCDGAYGYHIPFRLAESPFFIPKVLKQRLHDACEQIMDVVCHPSYNEKVKDAIPDPRYVVKNEDDHTLFLQMDFGITLDEQGLPMPKLIEIQGFPSVYFFQHFLSQKYKSFYNLPDHLSTYIEPQMTDEVYLALLKAAIVGDVDPAQVVMLEIEPEKQNTYIDFICTQAELGIKVLCLTKVKKDGRKLYYENEDGERIDILKIYNRVIFDELDQRPDLSFNFSWTDDLDVEWIGHPNWFYKISKYTLPLLQNEYVPKTYYLHDLKSLPTDLENYVLKPLFSFSGSGVIIDVDETIVKNIEPKSNYILQEKVTYHPVIESPNESVKCEVRMLMFWPKEAKRARIVNNLVRLSKGKMIGVKYNKDKDWVGGSVGFFEH